MNSPRQNAWNFGSLFVYLGLLILVGFLLKKKGVDLINIPPREIIVIILATYRLTRIIVFEKILKFLRDFVRSKQNFTVLNTVRFIITCPWCAGVWVAMIIVVIYYFVPYGVFIVYVLAISGVASFIVLLANITGLVIEEKQSPRRHKDD